MESHFLAYMYRLKYIKRWSLMRNTTHESVAEHSFHVALITHMLCTIANEVFSKDIPTEHLVSAALFHDATEVFTGDIPTPVKHHNPEILANFRKIEDRAAKRLVQMVPKILQPVYKPLLESRKSDDPNLRYLKAADLLDAYMKCTTEVSAGNREFAYAKKQIGENLHKLEMPEVLYFLEHLAPSLEKSLDELSSQQE
jgi:5'-deoxynucleotidase